MFKQFKGNKLLFLFLVVNSALLVVNGVFLYKYLERPSSTADAQYPLLAKRIFSESQSDIIINFISLRKAIRDYTAPLGDSLGVYFEYLPSGVSIGVNDRKETRLASLAKVPTVIAAYRMVNHQQLTRDKLLTIEEAHRDQTFGSLWRKQAGEKISVQEAARLAIVESDNTAHNVLLASVPVKEINAVYDSLDIPFDQENGYPIISAKSYSSILRALYLSSYLPKEYSNEILKTMTETVYDDKIPSKLPGDVKVAHKVGVFERQAPATSSFSDCGIVYVPNRPFLLCMMGTGNEQQVREHISTVSKMVYDYVSTVDGRPAARQ